MSDYRYLVQCPAGDVFGVKPGTELEELCRQNTRIDALCLGPSDCPGCVDRVRRDAEQRLRMLEEVGCPMNHGLDEQCEGPGGCVGATGINDLPTSKYDDQVVGLPAMATTR